MEYKLIAELSNEKIFYIICQNDEKSVYQIFKKKISENLGIKKGKIFNFDMASKIISQDIKNLEKETNLIFRKVHIILDETDLTCTNFSGFKKLNGSRVDKKDLDYILNEAKISIKSDQKTNTILHILNSNFTLDKITRTTVPLNIHGDRLSLHMTFLSIPENSCKNIESLFSSVDLKVERIISKQLVSGINFFKNNENSELNNFILINLDKEISSVTVYENSSIIFLKSFPFGTNLILRDINKLCSIKESEIRKILKRVKFDENINQKKLYLDADFFKESEFKKISINHLKEIIKSRVDEMTNYIYYKNRSVMNNKFINLYLFFEDDDVYKALNPMFVHLINENSPNKKVSVSISDNFSALTGAAELIFKGWDKEAIPLEIKKKSIISSFFERFF